jgi:hypothetical protein
MTTATRSVSLSLLFELPLGAQPMVKLASMRLAFIDPNQVGALPDLAIFGSIASRGGDISRGARIGTPARFSRRFVGH